VGRSTSRGASLSACPRDSLLVPLVGVRVSDTGFISEAVTVLETEYRFWMTRGERAVVLVSNADTLVSAFGYRGTSKTWGGGGGGELEGSKH
jgi:hypothetical protein